MNEKSIFTQLLAGGFTPGDSMLHRLSPGKKISLALLMVCILGLGHWPGIAAVAAVCLLGLIGSGLRPGGVFRRFRFFLGFLIAVGVFPVLFTPGSGAEPHSGFPLSVTWEGLEAGALATCRLTLMFLVSMILMHTTAPGDLIRPMEEIGGRFSQSRGPIGEIITVGVLAFQLLPIICVETERWFHARIGKETIKGNLFRKAGQVGRLLLPLTVSVLNDAERFSRQLKIPPSREGTGGPARPN
ncbi:MAG: energy-coupling factor transporter transmembrane component T family protein [Nitrospinaceae bacterium]